MGGCSHYRVSENIQEHFGSFSNQLEERCRGMFAKEPECQADWQFKSYQDSSDWRLNSPMFSQIMKIKGVPQVDLNGFHMHCQLPKYMSSTAIEKPLRVCIIPSVLPNWKSLDQIAEGSDYFSLHNINITNSAMVHNAALSICLTSNNFIQSDSFVAWSSGTDLPTTTRKPVASISKDNFKKNAEE